MIKNIIVDFGGVIIGIDYHKTYDQLSDLLSIPVDSLAHTIHKDVEEYNRGLIKDETFIWKLQKLAKQTPQGQDIIKAWNAMLLTFDPSNLEYLNELSQSYSLYLLSNVNAIHLKAVYHKLKGHMSIESFEGLFTDIYYSHLIHLTKPDTAIFHHVLEQSSLDPRETIFIDDTLQHTRAAGNTGIESFHHVRNSSLRKSIPAYISTAESLSQQHKN